MTTEALYPSYNVFGFKVTPMTIEEQIDLITRTIETRQTTVISPLNVHGLHVLQQPDSAMLKLHGTNNTYVVIDGMPIVALSRLAGVPLAPRHRVTNLDLIWPLLSLASERGWRVYWVGNTEESNERGLREVRKRVPNLQLRGHHGFVGLDCPDVIADIVEFGANIILVGMGAGRQEHWALSNLDKLPPSSIMCCGALLEYIGGTVKTPPRWMGQMGLEWLFRLMDDPKRFWWRYLFEPWGVLRTMAGTMLRRRLGLSK